MQKMLRLPLSKRFDKPVVRLPDYGHIFCLFDTGASIAVWCSDVEYFKKSFPKAKDADSKVWLSGFGGDGEIAAVYSIPEFILKTGEISVRFRELRVAISTKLRYGFDLILPGVIFSKMDIRINHRCSENSIQIYFDRDEYGIGMSIRHFTPGQLNKISEKYGVDLSENQAFGNTEYCFVRGADEVF